MWCRMVHFFSFFKSPHLGLSVRTAHICRQVMLADQNALSGPFLAPDP